MGHRRLVELPFQTDMAIGQGADLFNVFALVSELWILSRGINMYVTTI